MGTTADPETGRSKDSGPQLMFDDQPSTTTGAASEARQIDMFRGENLRKMALQNLKDRRQRQKQSEIFNQQEQLRKKEEEVQENEDEGAATEQGIERIDLTQSQMAAAQEGGDQANQVDDFDLLEAKIDPKDIKTMEKVSRLEDEIEYEKTKIKVKFIFKYSFQTNDPMKIAE